MRKAVRIAKRPSMLTTYILFLINKWFNPDRQGEIDRERQTEKKTDRDKYMHTI